MTNEPNHPTPRLYDSYVRIPPHVPMTLPCYRYRASDDDDSWYLRWGALLNRVYVYGRPVSADRAGGPREQRPPWTCTCLRIASSSVLRFRCFLHSIDRTRRILRERETAIHPTRNAVSRTTASHTAALAVASVYLYISRYSRSQHLSSNNVLTYVQFRGEFECTHQKRVSLRAFTFGFAITKLKLTFTMTHHYDSSL